MVKCGEKLQFPDITDGKGNDKGRETDNGDKTCISIRRGEETQVKGGGINSEQKTHWFKITDGKRDREREGREREREREVTTTHLISLSSHTILRVPGVGVAHSTSQRTHAL